MVGLYDEGGIAAVLSLARLTDTAGYLGKALYDSGTDWPDLDALLEAAARSDDSRVRDVAHGLINSVFRDRKEPWAAALIAKARAEKWSDTALSDGPPRFPGRALDLEESRRVRR